MLVAVIVAVRRFRGRAQYAAIAVAIVAASTGACALVLAVDDAVDAARGIARLPPLSLQTLVADALRYAVLGALAAGTWLYVRVEEQSLAAAHQCEVEAEGLEAQLARARLRVLEAQIEPHFLFNVLATVKCLLHSDPSTADRMLENLMRYLSMALPDVRVAPSTLGRESALARAYLDIEKIRMGERLAYSIDIPSPLSEASMPPLMLTTLVENAIKHGIGPLPDGGHIAISARAHRATLRVEVSDTGRGFVTTSGAGLGLANIRARLACKFGQFSRLAFACVDPHGVAVSIELPLELAVASAA
jgi:LytS/YehU family sensor histidine kinase